jgi:predicted transposase/invertase (TIGR01784 family)
LKEVYVVAILDFIFEEGRNEPDKYRYDVMLTDIETHNIFYKKLKFVYLEMPKFTKSVDELDTHFDKWLYVLKNLRRLDSIPDKLRERVFEKMFEVAEIAKLSPEDYRVYVNHLNSYRDLKNSLDYAEKKGKIEGRLEGKLEGRLEGKLEGIIEGIAKGKTEGKLEIAKKLKASGMSLEQIIEITNLTTEELKVI